MRRTAGEAVRRWSSRRFASSESARKDVLQELEARGLLFQATSRRQLSEHLQQQRACYLGVDPSAPSLHLGNLLAIIGLLHFQLRGHTALFLVGQGTGAIGDPSGRSSERQALSHEVLSRNVAAITKQLTELCQRGVSHAAKRAGVSGASSNVKFLNNHDWLGKMSLLDFLGGPGKRARVSTMLARESVKNRLHSSSGISFTEFSYQLLQGYDFYHLHKHHNCTMQIGGSDQYGNIQSGIDMIRREALSDEDFRQSLLEGKEESLTKEQTSAFGITLPLLTTSTGEKFGKSAGNAVWLDPEQTSPFELYQFLLKSTDADVKKYLQMLTFVPLDEIDATMAEHQAKPDQRAAQKLLAGEVTELVHGSSGLKSAERATQIMFGTAELGSISAVDILGAFSKTQKHTISRDELSKVNLLALAVASGLVSSKSQARQMIANGGLSLNDKKITEVGYKLSEPDLLGGRVAVLKAGKSNMRLIEIV
ncbi:tyrosyl-tRNA synthetase [Cystobasidium minutum MCA 4210]|uniref:tyrosyl-tRNA synthetase n=1 Tax=Cystobasidium minutum MCA 4210 TaxID=1397322 RepID=UPI0034CEFB93|eukprot:jgi/Rhomi1/47758/CE47757_637